MLHPLHGDNSIRDGGGDCQLWGRKNKGFLPFVPDRSERQIIWRNIAHKVITSQTKSDLTGIVKTNHGAGVKEKFLSLVRKTAIYG